MDANRNIFNLLIILFLLFFSLAIFFSLRANAATANEADYARSILTHELRDQLKNNQQLIYTQHKNLGWDVRGSQYVDRNSIEYAMAMADQGDVVAEAWAVSSLNAELQFLEPQGSAITSNNDNTRWRPPENADNLFSLSRNLFIYALAYSYWHTPSYFEISDSIVKYMLSVLLNESGGFYHSASNHSIYANENGLAISALNALYSCTSEINLISTSVKTEKYITSHYKLLNGGFIHDIKSKDDLYLADNSAMGLAYLSLYKATTIRKYLIMADQTATFIQKNFIMADKTGFINHIHISKPNKASAVDADNLMQVLKFMNIMYHYTGNMAYRDIAILAMKKLLLPEIITKKPPGFILLADLRVSMDPLYITIVGSKSDASAYNLYNIGLAYPSIYKRIEWLDPKEGPLPFQHVKYPKLNKSAAFLCINQQCSAPIFSPGDMAMFIRQLGAPKSVLSSGRTTPVSFTKQIDSKISVISEQSKIEEYLVKYRWYVIIPLFWFLGLLLSLTPCVFPLLLIIAGLLGSGVVTTSKSRLIGLSIVYILSLSITYVAIGLMVSLTGVYVQAYMQNVWIVASFGILFTFLGAAALNIFTLRLPDKWRYAMVRQNNFRAAGSYTGVALMGVFATLIASPCLLPPLLGLLSYVAKSHDVVFACLALFSMGIGIGSPLLVATILGVNMLPKKGVWQENIRIFFGILLLSVAIIIFSTILPHYATLLMWAALVFLTAIYLGVFSTVPDSNLGKIGKVFSLIILIYGAILVFGAFTGGESPLNPLEFTQKKSTALATRFRIINNADELNKLFERSANEHKIILLDFSADWCHACIALDKNIFSNPEVQNVLEDEFMMLRVDLTDVNSEGASLAHQFNIVAPPAILFFNENNEQLDVRIENDISAEKFITVLNNILSRKIKPIR